jgi:hypothetical protein
VTTATQDGVVQFFLASIIVRRSQCKASPGEVLVPTHGQATVEGHHGFHSPAGATPRGLRASDYCHGSTTSRGHQRHGGNATRAPTPQGHQRHGGSGPRTTAMGAHSRAGTNATGAQGHWLLPRGAQDLVLQPDNQSREDFSSPEPWRTNMQWPPWPQTATPTIQFLQIADSALQFWSGNFPALMRTIRNRTPMSIQQLQQQVA